MKWKALGPALVVLTIVSTLPTSSANSPYYIRVVATGASTGQDYAPLPTAVENSLLDLSKSAPLDLGCAPEACSSERIPANEWFWVTAQIFDAAGGPVPNALVDIVLGYSDGRDAAHLGRTAADGTLRMLAPAMRTDDSSVTAAVATGTLTDSFEWLTGPAIPTDPRETHVFPTNGWTDVQLNVTAPGYVFVSISSAGRNPDDSPVHAGIIDSNITVNSSSNLLASYFVASGVAAAAQVNATPVVLDQRLPIEGTIDGSSGENTVQGWFTNGTLSVRVRIARLGITGPDFGLTIFANSSQYTLKTLSSGSVGGTDAEPTSGGARITTSGQGVSVADQVAEINVTSGQSITIGAVAAGISESGVGTISNGVHSVSKAIDRSTSLVVFANGNCASSWSASLSQQSGASRGTVALVNAPGLTLSAAVTSAFSTGTCGL